MQAKEVATLLSSTAVASPPISITVDPKTKEDQGRLAVGLQNLMAEDPTFRVQTDQETGQVIIAGMSELHLEIIVDRLWREFGVKAMLGKPQVAFKETFTQPSDGEMKYAKQTGGSGQYGHVKIHLFPGETGSGYVFESAVAGSIPNEFIKSIDEGIMEALRRGVLAGYPIDDVRIELYDGSYHEHDSSEMAFEIAGVMAFRDAATKAQPVLLEPIMRVEVNVPEDHISDVVDDLLSRRGEIQTQEDRGGIEIIQARVPLAEMLGYATDLRSRTRGRATYSMYFDQYRPVEPPEDPDIQVRQPRGCDQGGRNSAATVTEPKQDPSTDARSPGLREPSWFCRQHGPARRGGPCATEPLSWDALVVRFEWRRHHSRSSLER